MRSGFRIGRLFGIDIRVDWSWLFILLLTTWNLNVVFGQFHPQWGAPLRWTIALVAALLFFASVLAHELAHSLVARARGIPVRNITLFLFGGVSNLQQEPNSPGVEFLMAIVGPLTSIVLGIVLIVIAGLLAVPTGGLGMGAAELISRIGPGTTLLLWLGSINVTVGIFNLIPGFPLDGGRVLRSILWGISGSLRRATRWATWVGQAIAWTMIVAGIAMIFGVQIPFFGTGFSSGLWLAFIGWFLNSAASQSYQRIVVRDMLEGVSVRQMMRSCPPTVSSGIPISSLIHDHVMKTDESGFPVLDNGHIVGIITLDDIRKVPREAWDNTTVREVMTPADQMVVTRPEEDAADALEKLMTRDVRQLPVLNGAELAGCLRRQDIVKWLQLESDATSGLRV